MIFKWFLWFSDTSVCCYGKVRVMLKVTVASKGPAVTQGPLTVAALPRACGVQRKSARMCSHIGGGGWERCKEGKRTDPLAPTQTHKLKWLQGETPCHNKIIRVNSELSNVWKITINSSFVCLGQNDEEIEISERNFLLQDLDRKRDPGAKGAEWAHVGFLPETRLPLPHSGCVALLGLGNTCSHQGEVSFCDPWHHFLFFLINFLPRLWHCWDLGLKEISMASAGPEGFSEYTPESWCLPFSKTLHSFVS